MIFSKVNSNIHFPSILYFSRHLIQLYDIMDKRHDSFCQSFESTQALWVKFGRNWKPCRWTEPVILKFTIITYCDWVMWILLENYFKSVCTCEILSHLYSNSMTSKLSNSDLFTYVNVYKSVYVYASNCVCLCVCMCV